jgi:hypothetical protein
VLKNLGTDRVGFFGRDLGDELEAERLQARKEVDAR